MTCSPGSFRLLPSTRSLFGGGSDSSFDGFNFDGSGLFSENDPANFATDFIFKTPEIPPKTPKTPRAIVQPMRSGVSSSNSQKSNQSSGFFFGEGGLNFRGSQISTGSGSSPFAPFAFRGFRSQSTTPRRSNSLITPKRAKTSGSAAKTSSASRTPATESTSTLTSGSSTRPYVVVAIAEGRGLAKGEIGLASMDIRHPELSVSQFSDTGAYAKLRVKLQIINPSEVVVPDSSVENGGNMLPLLGTLKQDFPKIKITPIKRRYFNEGQGIELIKRLRTDDCATVEKDIRDKYYGLACGAALIKHIEYVQNMVFAKRSVKVVYKGTEQTCMIDLGTAKHLELIVNLCDVTDTDQSLYGVINSTFTAGGARMLRASILQPAADQALIESRLEAITELKRDMPVFQELRTLISRMLDVDHLVALCSHLNREETARTAEYKITQTIYLKHTLELVDGLREVLSKYTNPLFRNLFEMLVDDRFSEILDKIDSVLREETRYEKNALNMLSQKCFAVKANINGYLDLARRTYSELVQDVDELCNDMIQETGLPFVVKYANGRDFYLHMQLRQDAPMPDQFETSSFLNVVRRSSIVSCTTRNLIKLNDRIKQTVNQIFSMSNAIVIQLLEEIRESITCLYNLTEVVSTVDFICSLTLFCSACPNAFVRPVFSDALSISQGRHPLLEKACEELTYYPNDAYAGPESNMIVITGPNMGGKSSYLKMVAILQVLAQMGSYVPAAYASFRITNQIFSRIGQNDDLENNCSAFMLEMRDVNYILQNFGNNSLIIIDELARSTSPEEGVAICHAVCEALVNSSAFVFLATHFLELTGLDGLYPNVENYHFEGPENPGGKSVRLVTNHTLKRGAYCGPSYGFEIAELASMPPQIISRGKVFAEELRARHGISEQEEIASRKERAIMRLGYRLKFAPHMNMEPGKRVQYLKFLKSQFEEDMLQAQFSVSSSNASQRSSTSQDSRYGASDSSGY